MPIMGRACSRVVVAALRGSAGKTTLAVALAVALRRRGKTVIPFKKGPDYIDAAWLSLAAAVLSHNLDTFLMGRDRVVDSFSRHAAGDAISLIEGNRGLYDGLTAEGEHSTAELAKLLAAPVVLVIDCDKATRTVAAMILGCQRFDPAVDIRGVILNRVGSARHAAIVRKSVEDRCRLPVLGAVPRLAEMLFTERHLGLIPPQESEGILPVLERAGDIAEKHLDMERLTGIAESAPAWEGRASDGATPAKGSGRGRVAIGVIRDRAFQFYYPENIQALADAGARVLEISALEDQGLPALDALYIGGGFPETQAEVLAGNERFRRSLREAAGQGLPIYAECGGFLYLGESLTIGERRYPLAGVLPVAFGMEQRPQGHGYTLAEVDRQNPFFPVGTKLKGHEFHYSRIISRKPDGEDTAFRILRGTGMGHKRDGLCRGNILAAFTHLHALGTPEWAAGMVAAARRYRAERRGKSLAPA